METMSKAKVKIALFRLLESDWNCALLGFVDGQLVCMNGDLAFLVELTTNILFVHAFRQFHNAFQRALVVFVTSTVLMFGFNDNVVALMMDFDVGWTEALEVARVLEVSVFVHAN